MVTISEIAAEKAKGILSGEGKQDWGIRVYMADNEGCSSSYGMDLEEKPVSGDEIIEKGDLRIFMDKVTYLSMSGKNIDFIEDGDQSGFVITGGEAEAAAEGASCNSGCNGCG